MKSFNIIAAAAFALCLAAAHPVKAADDIAAPPTTGKKKSEMSTFFMNLKDNDVVKSPLLVKMGVKGFRVAPAGTKTAGTGHLHLYVDTEFTDPHEEITTDMRHIHLGKGQKETTVTLGPGKHTLQIVVGDWNHVPFDPPVVSDKITVNVK